MRAGVVAILICCSCSEGTNRAGSVDASRVAVYFPVERGRVFGRGFAGATDSPWIYIAAHPAQYDSIVRAESDGSFAFDLPAESGDILELSGADNERALERGAPTFVRVPTRVYPDTDRWYCCSLSATCQAGFFADSIPCPEFKDGLTRCDEDADCFHLANEVLPIDVDRIAVSPPDEAGMIDIEGSVLPQSLVNIQNRRLSGLGIGTRSFDKTIIADLDGRFSLADLVARGDDELVIQLRNLENLRSPPAQILVPDARFSALDILSVESFEPVVDGRGVVAVRVAPSGIDGRGICPDGSEAPSTCFSGGMSHSMITAIDGRIPRTEVDLAPRPTAIDAAHPYVVGAPGERVRDGPRDLVLLLDMSAAAPDRDPAPPLRFAAAADLLRRLRARDRVGLVVVGGDRREVAVGPAADVIAEIDRLADEAPGGERDLFGAAARAASLLPRASSDRSGGVVAILTGDVPGTIGAALSGASSARQALGDRRVDILTVGAGANLEAMRRLARFGEVPGDAVNLSAIGELDGAALALSRDLIGAFVLLYDVALPDVGKQECIELNLSATIGGETIASAFRGVVTFEGAAGDPAPCK